MISNSLDTSPKCDQKVWTLSKVTRKCPKFYVLSEILIFSIDVDPDVPDLHNLGTPKKNSEFRFATELTMPQPPRKPQKRVGYAKIENVPQANA